MFRNAFDTTPAVRTFTWQQLTAGWASTRRTLNKETRSREIGLMSPATFEPAYRKKENVVEISVLILDIDCGVSVEQIFTRLKRYDCFVVETFHSTPEAPRWRVLIRLVAPIAAADYDDAWARVNRLLGDWLDPATKDSSRMLFLTCAAPDAPKRRYFVQEGVALDWRELKEAAQPTPRERRGSTRPGEHEDRRAAGMLAKWVDELSQQVPGSRRARLMQVAAAAGGLVANGLLDPANARNSLLAACDVNGLTAPPSAGGDGEEATERALEDALHHGEGAPWTPADFGDQSSWKPDSRNGAVRLGRQNGRLTREVREEQEEGPYVPDPLPEIPEFPLDVLSPLWGALATTTSLSPTLSIGAGLGVVSIAIGSESEVEVNPGRPQRPVLWIPLIAVAGAGKNGAIARAADVLDRHYQRERGLQSPTLPMPLRIGPGTVEALMADLHEMQEKAGSAALGIVGGELRQFLDGLGQYSRNQSNDKAVFLDLWSADQPMTYRRRGTNPGVRNKIALDIDRPTVPVLGGLIPEFQHLLGPAQGDGTRSRWLPFYARDLGPDVDYRDDGVPFEWNQRVKALLELRAHRRVWRIRGEARELFEEIRKRWLKEAYLPGQSSTIQTFFRRGVDHLARVALVLAEFENPGVGGEIAAWIIEAAGAVVRFAAKCWLALGEESVAGLSQADTSINGLIRDKLIPALEALRHGEGRILQNDLRRKRVVTRNPDDFKRVMAAYAAQYGGELVVRREGVGGQAKIWVYPPAREG